MGGFHLSRGRLVVLGCLLITGYFVYTAGTDALRSHRQADDRAEAQRELVALQQSKTYLEAVRDYVASDAYVEQEARRQLGYVKDGEVPFVVVSPPAEGAPTLSGAGWWERLFPR